MSFENFTSRIFISPRTFIGQTRVDDQVQISFKPMTSFDMWQGIFEHELARTAIRGPSREYGVGMGESWFLKHGDLIVLVTIRGLESKT